MEGEGSRGRCREKVVEGDVGGGRGWWREIRWRERVVEGD